MAGLQELGRVLKVMSQASLQHMPRVNRIIPSFFNLDIFLSQEGYCIISPHCKFMELLKEFLEF